MSRGERDRPHGKGALLVSVLPREAYFLMSTRHSKGKKRGLTCLWSFGFNPTGVTADSGCTADTKSCIMTWVRMPISCKPKSHWMHFDAPKLKHNSKLLTISAVWNQLYIWTSAAGPPTPSHLRTKHSTPTPKNTICQARCRDLFGTRKKVCSHFTCA